MATRKMVNKYYPPEYDYREEKRKKKKVDVLRITFMLPISVQCDSCTEFMSKGSKINANKEKAPEYNYLTVEAYRFTFKCRQCGQEIELHTVPKDAKYVVGKGGEVLEESHFDKEAFMRSTVLYAPKEEKGEEALYEKQRQVQQELTHREDIKRLQQRLDHRAQAHKRLLSSCPTKRKKVKRVEVKKIAWDE